MINTIEECDSELMRIDSEFKRLQLERDHILNVRKLLGQQPTIRLIKPLTERIIDVLTANPGINTVTIHSALNDRALNTRQISFTLANLRKDGRVENRGSRGGRGRTAQWYVVEKP